MAEDDIYESKRKYESILENLEAFAIKPIQNKKSLYFCKNRINLEYFTKLVASFESKDLSYIRRAKILSVLRMICYIIEKNLKEVSREDIDSLIAFSHKRYKTVSAKQDLIKDVKCIWKMLFPEKDQYGRIDEKIMPYPVRHLSRKVDKSKERLRNDRLTLQEFEQILQFFAGDTQMQAYLMLALESLGRPQEILSLCSLGFPGILWHYQVYEE